LAQANIRQAFCGLANLLLPLPLPLLQPPLLALLPGYKGPTHLPWASIDQVPL
jgi:hypothetical protein